ncbi:hypothetical protein ACFWJ4_38325 [Kitasatospora sp. NPDC127067]|uniref:hypothetical protein n=1 Tax=Kitasatospora sp. NPDC127067 TaxID=3347126 RepID=UPI00365B0FE0
MCIIGPDVRVGRGTNLIGHVRVEGPTVIGEDNQVFPFACLGGPSQTRSRPVDAEPMLVIGDRNQIRETVTIHRGSTASSTTRIGDDCLIPRQTLRHIVDAVRVWTTRTDLSRADRLHHMEARHGHLPEVKNLVDFLTTRGALPNARQPSRLPTAGRLLPPTQRSEVPSPPG